MRIGGIICEYNPLHLGHKKQMDTLSGMLPEGSGIVALMSGNYVQRGHPAIVDKMTRAKAAIAAGADLVLELPVTYALQSAEGFAAGGVEILSDFCDYLCFGAESPDPQALQKAAQAQLSDTYRLHLQAELKKGLSFPAARQKALEDLGVDAKLVSSPNNILAVEYCKAIVVQGSSLIPLPIFRAGSYHDVKADPENPSATALRQLLLAGEDIASYVPSPQSGTVHALPYGEQAILTRLRTMTDDQFEALPYGSEGLWRKFMHASRQEARLEEILAATKSKRYTRSRLDRMAMCAFLGLTQQDLATPAPYVRVLALNEKGRILLKKARQKGYFPNIGEKIDHPYQAIEDRCDALYGLFAESPEPPAPKYRIYYGSTAPKASPQVEAGIYEVRAKD